MSDSTTGAVLNRASPRIDITTRIDGVAFEAAWPDRLSTVFGDQSIWSSAGRSRCRTRLPSPGLRTCSIWRCREARLTNPSEAFARRIRRRGSTRQPASSQTRVPSCQLCQSKVRRRYRPRNQRHVPSADAANRVIAQRRPLVRRRPARQRAGSTSTVGSRRRDCQSVLGRRMSTALPGRDRQADRDGLEHDTDGSVNGRTRSSTTAIVISVRIITTESAHTLARIPRAVVPRSVPRAWQ